MDLPLCGTTLTGEKLQNLLIESNQLLTNGQNLISVNPETLSDQGYTSTVFRVNLIWSPLVKCSLPKSLIVKTIGSNAIDQLFQSKSKEELDELKKQVIISHNVECSIYHLAELNSVVPVPRCYVALKDKSEQPGIIVLEDMKDQAAILPKMIMFGIGLNSKQLEEVLQVITDLQAWSLNTKINWQKIIPNQAGNPAIPLACEFRRDAFAESKAEYSELFENVQERKVMEFINTKQYLNIFGSDPRLKYNTPLVLVHGDIQLMNMMFEVSPTENKDISLRALLDWQLAHQGCGAEDLARLFGGCLSTKTRRELGDNIVLRYVQLFNSKVQNIENHVKFEDVKKALEEMFAFFSVMNACGVSQMKTYVSRLNGVTEDERRLINSYLIDRIFANYQDALKILDW